MVANLEVQFKEGGTITTSTDQNAGRTEEAESAVDSPVHHSEKSVPPGMESRSPCAPLEVLRGMFFVLIAGVLGGIGLFTSQIKRFARYIWSRSAYNDPRLQMTNFGWRPRP
jgi:hypothetical protein